MRERKVNDAIRMPKHISYWLLVRDERNETEILTTKLSDGRQALPVFSFEKEAEMFLCLRGSRDGWRVRKTAVGELLSMLYTVLRGIECVTLDPIPESSCLDATGLLSLRRKDFMDRLGARTAEMWLPRRGLVYL